MPCADGAWHDRSVRPRTRLETAALPSELGSRDGVAYSLWLPKHVAEARGGVVILHGAGSCKESHYDFARALIAIGFAAVAFDQRGHGESGGVLDGRMLDDIAAMTALLRESVGDRSAPVALRGSSMGAYVAIIAAPLVAAAAVVAICPPSAEALRRGLAAGAVRFDADVPSLDAFLAAHDLDAGVGALAVPLLLLHAEGDEQVPVEHSRELEKLFSSSRSRLITVPGGHHRSVQHDPELQAVSLRFIERTLAPVPPRRVGARESREPA